MGITDEEEKKEDGEIYGKRVVGHTYTQTKGNLKYQTGRGVYNIAL